MSDATENDTIAAIVLAASQARGEVLRSIVETARAIFAAQAASIALLDEARGVFVFEAVSGRGDPALVGKTFARGQGLAGAVAQSGEPLVVDDIAQDPRFARDVAERSGYIPRAIMVCPLLHGEDTLGVLSVLDRGTAGRTTLQDLDALVAFAQQAVLALVQGEAAVTAQRLLDERPPQEIAELTRILSALSSSTGERREAGHALLAALAKLL